MKTKINDLALLNYMKIAIGSENKAKIQATKEIFEKYMADSKNEFYSIKTDSKVSEQPLNLDEGMLGATNRALQCLDETDADFGIGLEGTVHTLKSGMYLVGCAAIAEREKKIYQGFSAGAFIPEDIRKEIEVGKELGPLMLELTKDDKLRGEGGANSVFTDGLYTRVDEFKDALKVALGSYRVRKKS